MPTTDGRHRGTGRDDERTTAHRPAPRRASTTRSSGAAARRTRAEREERQRRVVLVVVLALLAGICFAGWWAANAARDWVSGFGTSQCRAVAGSYTGSLDAEAMGNAALITAIAQKRALPPRAATIAIATAMQESKLHNIGHGDRDSVGLFQQRPSQGWGTEAQIMDPHFATNAFFDALVKIPGWQTGEITKVAQAVQRSGYPEAYAQHEPEARAIASNLTGETQAGLGCRIAPLENGDHRAGGAKIAENLTAELGVATAREKVSGDTLTVSASSAKTAWAVGSWAVAKSGEHGISSVTVGDREWTRTKDTSGWEWHRAADPVGATTVVIR